MAGQLKPDAVLKNKLLKRKAIEEAVIASDGEQVTKKNLPSKKEHKMTGSDNDVSEAKPYRLTIEIDKIYLSPYSLSENIPPMEVQNKTNYSQNKKVKQNSLQCLVCKKLFSDTIDLYTHIKIHFTCDICNIEFISRKSYEKHYKLHQSNLKQCPYKCNICDLHFEKKDDLRKHNHIAMDTYNEDNEDNEGNEENQIEYCKSCSITFSDEDIFREHLDFHLS